MLDLIMLATGLVFFVLTIGYLRPATGSKEAPP